MPRKILKCEGMGERSFSESHASALLAYPGSVWKFVRNENEPNHLRHSEDTKAPIETEGSGGSDAPPTTGEDAQRTGGKVKRRRKA